MNSILQSFKIKHYETFYCNIDSVIGKLRCLEDNQNWHTEMLQERFSTRGRQMECRLTHCEVREFLDDVCLL